MSKRLDYEPQPMARGLVIGYLVSVALIAGTLAWCHVTDRGGMQWDATQRAHLESGVLFPPLEIDTDRLEEARNEVLEESPDADMELLEDDIQQLHAAFRTANSAQFGDGEGDTPQPSREIIDRAHYLSNDVVVVTGPGGFQEIGAPVFSACLNGLDELLDAIRSGDLEFSVALEDPPAQRFGAYRENCGNLLPQLYRRGLVSDSGELQHPQAMEIVDILQRYRWADLLHNRYDINSQWSDYELELFARWRFEDPRAFNPPERRRYLDQALQHGHLPDDYDVPLAEARLEAASATTDQEIVEPFEELVEEHPDNEFHQALLERIKD